MAYNNEWAKIDHADAAYPITGRTFNDIGASIRNWGWGQSSGTITINANENTLANLGVLVFKTNGYVSGKLRVIQSSGTVPAVDVYVSANAGGSTDAAYILDDRGYGGANTGNVLRLRAFSTGGDDTGCLVRAEAWDGGTATPVLLARIDGRTFTPRMAVYEINSLVNDAPLYGIGYSNQSLGTGLANAVQLSGWGGVLIKTASGQVAITNQGRLVHTPPDTYANNAAAVAGGLQAGTWYKTSTGDLKVVY